MVPGSLSSCFCRSTKLLQATYSISGSAWRQVMTRLTVTSGMPPLNLNIHDSQGSPILSVSVMTLNSGELSSLSEEILRRQRIIDEQLAELKEITVRLTPEEQKELLEVIKQKDADAVEQREQVCSKHHAI